MTLGNKSIVKGQPVFYLDTAKTSTIEGAATTVYAQGGRGNTRLIAWEGQKTLTFTVEDALLSPISFAMLSGAGLVKGNSSQTVHFHQTSSLVASSTDGSIDLENALEPGEEVDLNAPLFILMTDNSGDLTGEMVAASYVFETKVQDGISTTNYKKLILENFDPNISVSDVPVVYNPKGDNLSKDKNTAEDWRTVITRATSDASESSSVGEKQDWSYAEPLTKKQVVYKAASSMKQNIYAYTVTTENETTIYTLNNQSPKSIRTLYNTVFANQLGDGCYSLNTNVIPYNISHLQVQVGELKTTKGVNDTYYKIPDITIVFQNGSTMPTFSAEADSLLGSVTEINSIVGTSKIYDTLQIMYKYGKYGASALTTDEENIVTKFLKIQAALQYYYYGYVNKFTEITTTESEHQHTFTELNSLMTLLGFTTDKIFEQASSTAAKAYEKTNSEYKSSSLTSMNIAYYKAIGLADIEEKAKSYDNGVAFYKTAGKTVMVDYYVTKAADSVSELQIDASNFAGYYYVEADTLFRRQIDGKDLPANITFPNVKIQSNFTFSMAPTGDPSTFTFTMDAMPGYTYFDKTKKVLCAIQIVDDTKDNKKTQKTVFGHPAGTIEISKNDSSPDAFDD